MIDPVCGMDVEPSNAAGSHVRNGQTYFFCNHHSLQKFKEERSCAHAFCGFCLWSIRVLTVFSFIDRREIY